MDEPLSNLDAKLRNDMRAELKRLHMATGATFVYVTHDQSEAMTLSSKVCLIKEGVLQQYCPPLTLYGEPANLFCADFMGNPTMNFISCHGIKKDQAVELTCRHFSVRFTPNQPLALPAEGDYVLGVRPEFVKVSADEGIEGTVVSSLPSGMETTLSLAVKDITLSAVAFGSIDFAMDSVIHFGFEGDRYILFDAQSTENLGLGSLQILN